MLLLPNMYCLETKNKKTSEETHDPIFSFIQLQAFLLRVNIVSLDNKVVR
jgi:hypothetical protein